MTNPDSRQNQRTSNAFDCMCVKIFSLPGQTHLTVVRSLTSRGRSLIYFCHVVAGIYIFLLLSGFLIMSDSKKMCQLLFLDNHIMPAQWALWRPIYYRGDKYVPAAIFLRNRSPGLIKSDSPSSHKYLSAHLWKAGELWLLYSFCHMKVQMETLKGWELHQS